MYNRIRDTSNQMESPYNRIRDTSNQMEESPYNNIPDLSNQMEESPYNNIPDLSNQIEESPYNNIPDFRHEMEESPYNNIPDFGAQKKESPYGKMPKLEGPLMGKSESPYGKVSSVAEVMNRVAASNGAKQAQMRAENPPANVKRPLPRLPDKVDPAAIGGREHIVTDKKVMTDPKGRKEQHASPVRDQDYFIGRVVSQKDSGGLILKSAMSQDDEKADTLIHLPKSAVDQLKKNPGFSEALRNSMTYGKEGSTLGITHDAGKWSYSGDGLPANSKKLK